MTDWWTSYERCVRAQQADPRNADRNADRDAEICPLGVGISTGLSQIWTVEDGSRHLLLISVKDDAIVWP